MVSIPASLVSSRIRFRPVVWVWGILQADEYHTPSDVNIEPKDHGHSTEIEDVRKQHSRFATTPTEPVR